MNQTRVEEENLYNCVHHKTKKVIAYVNELKEPLMKGTYTEHLKRLERFHETISRAKEAKTANDMLDIIGYRYKQAPKVYD